LQPGISKAIRNPGFVDDQPRLRYHGEGGNMRQARAGHSQKVEVTVTHQLFAATQERDL
jgi:hypothetical protein